jgi:hypothetical protein
MAPGNHLMEDSFALGMINIVAPYWQVLYRFLPTHFALNLKP